MSGKPTAVRRDRSSSTVHIGAPAGSVAELVRRGKRALVSLFWAAVAALAATGAVAFLTSFEGAGAFAMVVGTAVFFSALAALPFVVVRVVVAVLAHVEG